MAKTVRNDKEELDQNRQSEEQNKALHHPLATHAREVREESSAGRGPVQDEVRGAVDVGARTRKRRRSRRTTGRGTATSPGKAGCRAAQGARLRFRLHPTPEPRRLICLRYKIYSSNMRHLIQ